MLNDQGLGFIDKPVHILTTDGRPAPRGINISSHASTLKLPGDSVIYVTDSISIASPELCFIHMATILPFPKLVELGYELCGEYRLSPGKDTGISKQPPLTSVEKLCTHIDSAQRANGAAAAKRATRYLANNSASPMETIVTLLLCLPTKTGGYGFPLPVLNQRKNMGSLAKLATVKDFYRCDLFWPEGNVAVEYDSKQHHSGDIKRAYDAQRANALRTKSITVLSVTPYQVFNYKLFDDLATLLALSLGRRLKKTRMDWTSQRLGLRRLLVDPLRSHHNRLSS